jgi:hypothetical protein
VVRHGRRESRAMKLVMTLLVRNEADIIEANLDYHLAQGVDFVIVTDHGSSDRTPELLSRYENAGALTVLHEQGDEHHQSVRVTHMAQLAHGRYDADWVIHNDADEFWWPLSGSLRDVFGSIPPQFGQIVVQRRNFLPRPQSTDPFYLRLMYREARSLNLSGRPLEPKVAHRAHPDVVVAPGNHAISGVQLRRVPVDELLEIFHFPMRSYDQFERKVTQTGTGYEALEQRSAEVGRDQLRLLELFRTGGLRDYYDQRLLSEEPEPDDLEATGTVLDRRLADYMHALHGGIPPASAPAGPATRTLLASGLKAFVELESARRELADQQARATTSERRLSEVQAQLLATGDALNMLRGSRLFRWTTALRRLYYRLR